MRRLPEGQSFSRDNLEAYFSAWTTSGKQPQGLRPQEVELLTRWHFLVAKELQKAAAEAVPTEWKLVNASENGETFGAAHLAFLLGDFAAVVQPTRDLLRGLGRKLRLLFADTNYGCSAGEWDKLWTKTEFTASIDFARDVNDGDLKGVNFAWFLADYQLLDCLSAARAAGLSWRLKTWVKDQNQAHGARFQQNSEHLLIAWFGDDESQVVTQVDGDLDRFR